MERAVSTSFLAYSRNKSNVQYLPCIFFFKKIWVNDEVSGHLNIFIWPKFSYLPSDQREASDWQILEKKFFTMDKFMRFMCTFSFPKSQTKCAIWKGESDLMSALWVLQWAACRHIWAPLQSSIDCSRAPWRYSVTRSCYTMALLAKVNH